LHAIRQYTQQELGRFPVGIKRFLNPHIYVVGMEKKLYDLKIHLIKQIRQLSPIAPNPY
jgi:nicotinate phosphoribosyltransferase